MITKKSKSLREQFHQGVGEEGDNERISKTKKTLFSPPDISPPTVFLFKLLGTCYGSRPYSFY